MHCENCGAKLNEGARFCAGCGKPVPGAQPEPKEPRPPRSFRDRLGAIVGRTRKERVVAAATAVAAVIAIIGFILLDTPEDEPNRDAYVRSADELCVVAKQRIAAAGAKAAASPGPGSQERYTATMLDSIASWQVAFAELEPTPGHVAEAEAVNDALLDVLIEVGGLARASREGSPAAVSARAAATDEAAVTLETAVADLGMTDCSSTAIAGTPAGS